MRGDALDFVQVLGPSLRLAHSASTRSAKTSGVSALTRILIRALLLSSRRGDGCRRAGWHPGSRAGAARANSLMKLPTIRSGPGRRRPGSAGSPKLAGLVLHRLQADVVHLDGGTVAHRAVHRDLELARRWAGLEVEVGPLADDLGHQGRPGPPVRRGRRRRTGRWWCCGCSCRWSGSRARCSAVASSARISGTSSSSGQLNAARSAGC